MRAAAPFAWYAVLVAWYCAPLFASPNGVGIYDWDQHLFYYASVFKSVASYGAFPFWNPWYCGGNVLWQNPQIPLLSPVFALGLTMSLPLAMKVSIALHFWTGLCGMHLLLRELSPEQPLAVTGSLASIAVLSGAMALHLAVGHSVFLPVLYLPLQAYFLVRAFRTGAVRHVVYAALPLALMVYNGALHAVPMSVAGVGAMSIGAAVARRSLRPVAVGLLVGVLGVAYAAPKLLPVVQFVTSERFVDARGAGEHPDAMSLEMLARTYLDRYQDRSPRYPEQRNAWYEYGNYVGVFGAAAIAAGVLLAFVVPGTPDRWLGLSLAGTTVLFLTLSAGEFASWAPASLARHVPVFSSFRIPSRYTFGVVLFGIATAGWAWRAVADGAVRHRGRSLVVATLFGLVAFDVAVQTRDQFIESFNLAPLERPFTLGGGSPEPPVVDVTTSAYSPDAPMVRALNRNVAFYNCYESLQLARTAGPSERWLSSDTATLSNIRFAPNGFEFAAIVGREPARVSLHQNFAPGWTSTAGPVVPGHGDGMVVTLPPGTAGRFAFTFTPPWLWPGTAIALVAVVVSAAFRRRHLWSADPGSAPND